MKKIAALSIAAALVLASCSGARGPNQERDAMLTDLCRAVPVLIDLVGQRADGGAPRPDSGTSRDAGADAR